ncbi:carboxypeptidase-like regulatory domain-containing protein [Sorangium sp. So ce1000]|uniref:carboxypeptidase-like regulatory domain-containing protein n=1 Tax=Sorangium sp. So ce1000 TaxID=3133325 RepID=UPI003F5ED080
MMEQNEQKLTVVGRVVDSRSPTGSDSAAGLPGVTVEVWLKAASTEVVAAVTTGSLGEFAVGLDAAALRPLLGAHPASAFFRVYQGSQLLIDTEESIMWHENGPNQTLRIPVDPTKPKGAGAPALWSVRGRVTDSRGAPLEGMIVHAYDRNLDPPAPKFLGNSATDAAGYYRIAYSRSQLGRASKAHADLEVSACKQNGATLLTLYTRRVCHAPATAVVECAWCRIAGSDARDRHSGIERAEPAARSLCGAPGGHPLVLKNAPQFGELAAGRHRRRAAHLSARGRDSPPRAAHQKAERAVPVRHGGFAA